MSEFLKPDDDFSQCAVCRYMMPPKVDGKMPVHADRRIRGASERFGVRIKKKERCSGSLTTPLVTKKISEWYRD